MADPWVIDYASPGSIDLQAFRDAGGVAIARYLSHYPSKNLSADEIATCKRLGLGVVAVWEDDGGVYGGGPARGHDQGVADAQAANDLADQLGIPAGVPLFYAVDTDSIDDGTVADYFRGVGSVGRRPVGGYGKGPLMHDLHVAGLIVAEWGTEAWSGSYVSPTGALYQRAGSTFANQFPDHDQNVILNPAYGQWYPAGGTAPTSEEDLFMAITDPNDPARQYLDGQFTLIRTEVEERINGLRVEVAQEIAAGSNATSSHDDRTALALGQTLLGQLSNDAKTDLARHDAELAILNLLGAKAGDAQALAQLAAAKTA